MSPLPEEATLRAVLRDAVERLRAAGVATPELDARVLAGHALGLSSAELIAAATERIDTAARARFAALVGRRAAREPVARIIGRREFWGLDFMLNSATLVPRPDSETVVEAALEMVERTWRRAAPLRIADLGTGSGCLLIALLTELPAAIGVGVDMSADALDAARFNAAQCQVGEHAVFTVGHWAEPLSSGFDIIVTNPPYIARREMPALPIEVTRHDPQAALDGGEDGLQAYRALLPSASRALARQGVLVMEHGIGQARALSELIEHEGLATAGSRHDLSGKARVLVARPRRIPGANTSA